MSARLDGYGRTLQRKRAELTKLKQDLAKEQAKIASLQKKIISANGVIGRSKNSATVKSKYSEIERLNKSIADLQKKSADIHGKIAKKETEIAKAEKDYRDEEVRVKKKNSENEKRRLQEAERQTTTMEQTLRRYGHLQNLMQIDIEKLKAIPERITVLFMAANPIDTNKLRLDEEARSIQEKIRLSEYRDSIDFVSRWAMRSSDILQAINETNPTIVHFSGHGGETGELALLNPDGTTKMVKQEAISMAMATASDTIRLVVFNACFTESQAISIVDHIETAIGMSDAIGDDAAIIFAAQLYSSIGFGHTLQTSFDQAVAALSLEGIPQLETPRIFAQDGLDLNEVILVRPNV